MTTGFRGMHVIVPLNRHADVDDVPAFTREVADVLVALTEAGQRPHRARAAGASRSCRNHG